MIHADAELAHRLEAIICADWRRLAAVAQEAWPDRDATSLDVAGGVALWLGEGSPVNVAVGLGMDAPVDELDLRRVEDFYAVRGAPPILQTCPFAHASLYALLARQDWQITEFENVLALELGAGELQAEVTEPTPADIGVRVCTPSERELWGHVAFREAVEADSEPSPAREEFGRLMALHPDIILVLAWVDGQPVGTGALAINDSVGWLMGDSTLPEHRRRGVQQAIQRYRLELARRAGCTLAVTESAPGSGSQRNMERLGFRVVYAHLEFTRL